MTDNQFSRRDFLRSGAAVAAGALLGGSTFGIWSGSSRLVAATTASGRRRALRLAHVTDIHVQPELGAGEGLAACLHHIQSQKDKPELILNGGDAVMDSLAQTQDRTKLQWKLWQDVWKKECNLPLESCIGNHDIWGWAKKESGATGNEVNYGKAWAMEALGLEKPYRSFDRGGWHFVVLDSVQQGKTRLYDGRLDGEQFDWLKEDLERVDSKTPVCILTHIPIMCAAIVFFSRDRNDGENYRVAGSNILMDALELSKLFIKHPNVKLCLSGHIHQTDRIDYNGVTYLCNGAVCGSWWRGKQQQCDNGYALIDLYDDGTFDHQYVNYGWKPRT